MDKGRHPQLRQWQTSAFVLRCICLQVTIGHCIPATHCIRVISSFEIIALDVVVYCASLTCMAGPLFSTGPLMLLHTYRQSDRRTDGRMSKDGFAITISRCACTACWRAVMTSKLQECCDWKQDSAVNSVRNAITGQHLWLSEVSHMLSVYTLFRCVKKLTIMWSGREFVRLVMLRFVYRNCKFIRSRWWNWTNYSSNINLIPVGISTSQYARKLIGYTGVGLLMRMGMERRQGKWW